jgi:outer membrane biosynthesis protein TonB
MTALNFFSANRSLVIVGGGAVVVAGGLAFMLTHGSRQGPPAPPPTIPVVIIQPPKPPPPPPPLPQPKTITPPKMTTPEMKPVTPTVAPPKPAAPAQTHMGTSIHSAGPPDAFNLGGTPGGDGMFDGGGGGGTAEGYFESVVTSQIRNALQNNPVTRKASAGLQVRIWADDGGRVTRVELDKSSGDPVVDAAITNQVLLNMQLNQPPPAGTPMPIDMSLVGEQPLQ